MAEVGQQGISTPGELLRSARQVHGWSIEEVAVELNLLPDVVQALENDDYQGLAGRTYVVGYLRSYGKLASVNVDGAIEGHYALMPPAQDGPGTMTEDLVRRQPVAIHYRWVVTALVLVVVVGGLYGAYLKRSDDVAKIPLAEVNKPEPVAALVREPLPKTILPTKGADPPPLKGDGGPEPDAIALLEKEKNDSTSNVKQLKAEQNPAGETPASDRSAVSPVANAALTADEEATDPVPVSSGSVDQGTAQPISEPAASPPVQTEPRTNIRYPSRQRSESSVREIVANSFIKTRFTDVINVPGGQTMASRVVPDSRPPVDEVKVKKTSGSATNKSEQRQKVVLVPDRELRVVVKESSQVIVWDGDGVQLFRGYLRAGKAVTVSGTPPFDVQIQSAEGAKVFYTGKSIYFSVPKSGQHARYIVGVED